MQSIRALIQEHGLTSSLAHNKKLGQNFLCDVSCLTPHIPDLSPYHVWEVGPGPGGLTRLLLSKKPKMFVATEYDDQCLTALQPLHQPPAVCINKGDALQTKPQDVFGEPDASIVITGNLPYNIGTALLMNWLQDLSNIHSIYIMLQKEVVDRLVAMPRTKAYGRLSVVTQLCCDVQPLIDLPPEWFTPQPKVISTFVRLKPKANRPTSQTLKVMEKLTHDVFSKRRKMLRQTLPQDLMDGIEGVQGHQRPEELPPTVFWDLAKKMQQLT